MKKKKTYEISVIDKTYSNTITDETKFYTSDTALELSFELKETEYNFESAEIVLLNIDDRSLVTRPVAKSLDSFAYELEDDITAHYGEWRGQLRFEQAGEIYVSSPVKFRIENDLSNDRPPQLSDVQSWVSLKRYADGLVDELKQAVLSVEGIEDTFNTNETVRQNQFSNAEQSRQDTFEDAESERDGTFKTNEDIRKTQELEREQAESSRQSEFEDNEASRFETFNTNEATRQGNETTRQQAESQRQTTFETAEQERQSAEITRVENENQRVLNYENMQETIDSIGKVNIVNIVENGNFSNGLYGWEITGIITSGSIVSDGKFHVYGENSGTTDTWPAVRQDTKTVVGHTYYFYIEISDMPENSTSLMLQDRNTVIMKDVRNGTHSKIETVREGQSLFKIYLNHTIQGGGFVDYKVDNIIVIDLSEIFGLGNEPSKEVMDWVISENGYFEDLSVSRDDIHQYEINQLRKAVIALGGTI